MNQPLVITSRSVALDVDVALELQLRQDRGGQVDVGVFLLDGVQDRPARGDPLLSLPPRCVPEVIRALAALADELGVRS